MYPIEIVHDEGDRFRARVRQHRILVDQPTDEGGTDHGPTPTEFFVLGLAACVGFYAERFLRRHSLSMDGLRVGCDFAFAEDRPARIGAITMVIHLDHPIPEAKRAAFERVIEHCTVHNTLRDAPDVRIEVEVPLAA